MTILLIEDDKGLAELLSEFLGMSGYKVVHRADGESGLNAALHYDNIDLILLDVMLPKLNGLDVLKVLRQHSEIPVLMLTARGDDLDKVLGLELGADDYLAKPFNDRELLARIRAIMRRTQERPVADEKLPANSQQKQLILGDVCLDLMRLEAHCHQQALELTGSEFAILKQLGLAPGELITKEVLSQKCLGRRLQAFDRSIDTHISNVRKKLAAVGSTCEIKSQRGRGYGIFSG
ncbi:response regulator [Alteromonas lipolytica]|uniref:DNA-binding response regulator n=1 Tax=Alteromonas lipolytica TaxID=1856405 RepID=A0A1E8FII7_9ALTE|nr:response regulator [Alteromonas lipolytica]OFI35751.1 DNA-binding response regulator [Alteromonas lipolytica]GGF80476.1 DNA-binding response regulator [Alteromonas lipolytica]